MINWLKRRSQRLDCIKQDAMKLSRQYGANAYKIALDRAEGRDNPRYLPEDYWLAVAARVARFAVVAEQTTDNFVSKPVWDREGRTLDTI